MNINQLHQHFLECNSVSTDTRKISFGNLFFALKGDNFNGNTFAKNALKKGAKYAVIDEQKYALNSNYIVVDNVLNTLQELASYHREYLGLKIIALTGSNGKTTTKELIYSVLKQKYNTVATLGNLNNHIGVPLTLLSMSKSTEIGIVEMGANHQKEIEFLCQIAKPDYGYITNFGKAHLEGFGGIEGVIKGKSELYKHLKKHHKLVFFNDNDALQTKMNNTYKNTYSFGKSTTNNISIEFLKADPFVTLRYNNIIIQSNLIGAYNFDNISAAICIGSYFSISTEAIKNGISQYIPENNRSQIITKGTRKIILDAYNANPTSMIAALDNFSNLKESYKIAILGDMFELGVEAHKEHQIIADYTLKLDVDSTYLVGGNFYNTTISSDKIKVFKTFEALKNKIENTSFENTTFLIKGSRGMALERLTELF